ncbi:MAG: hypothetical protein JRJ56_07780 [Deltaproteobacteria bacterium]|nr:hypothetical protein [Deltaproteobacteria bacterium]
MKELKRKVMGARAETQGDGRFPGQAGGRGRAGAQRQHEGDDRGNHKPQQTGK